MLNFFENFHKKEVHYTIWLLFPIIIFFSIFIAKFLDHEFYQDFFLTEKGFIENGTFVILFSSIIVSVFILKIIKNKLQNKIIYIWILVFLFGMIYFAGEEISWGQQWYNWNTISLFKSFNDQYETNFHNISGWFDQKPRFLLLFFVIVGGIYFPLFYKNKKLNRKNNISFFLFPTTCCLPTSLICLFFYLLDNLYKKLCHGTPGVDITCDYIPDLFRLRTSEIIEFYIAVFLFIYLLSIYIRLKKQ